MVANGNQFDKQEITVAAGSPVVIEFLNQDSVPHNFSAYENEALRGSIFRGELITGPNKRVAYTFAAPSQPGTYYFQCDVHPNMNGQLIVQ